MARAQGHTALLNFFKVGTALMLVDMPGYGFGSRPEWGDLILGYWRDREQYGAHAGARHARGAELKPLLAPRSGRAVGCGWRAC